MKRGRPLMTILLAAAQVALPLAATAVTLAWAIPSQMDAGRDGPWAWVAQARDQHPLLLALVLFVLFGAVARHWIERLRPAPRLVWHAPVWVALLALTLLVGGRLVLFDLLRVSGPSMAPTLHDGDLLLVNRLAYGLRGRALPRRGDLIVFDNPDRSAGRRLPPLVVKRVIGLPGDEISFRAGAPVINGWAVPACDVGPYLVVDGTTLVRARLAVEVLDGRACLTLRDPAADAQPRSFRVPPGQLFVLGDDRPISRDSRDWSSSPTGGVALASVRGRVSRLVLPDPSGGRFQLRRVLAALRPELHEPTTDVARLAGRVAACVAHAPPNSTPPRG